MRCQAKCGHKLGSDLKEILQKRQARSECSEEDFALFLQQGRDIQHMTKTLSRKEIREYQAIFNRFDRDADGFVCLEDLKVMMETIRAPQTHISLKKMIQEVVADGESKISFQEFVLICYKTNAGQYEEYSGFNDLAKITEVDTHEVGVDGAKNFFEAKIAQLKAQNKFEEEVKKEQEEKCKIELEKRQKRQEFQQKQAFFERVTLTN